MGVVCEVRRRLLYVAVLVCSLFTSGIIGQTSWTGLDIGNPAIAGNSSGTASELSITAAGSDIGGTSDQFYFVYQQIVGDVDVRARVDGITYGSWLAVAGVMIRGSLAADAAHGFALVSASYGTEFRRRTTASGWSASTAGMSAATPEWVRLVRKGSSVSAYSSPDGTTWTLIGSDTIQLGWAAYVGLAVTGHDPSAATTASLSQISVTPLGLPPGQQDADIGSPALAGSASYADGTYQIHAGGADIWGGSDQFHYVYQPLSGDADVSVRVASLSYSDAWAKGGVMIRETLSEDSTYAAAFLTPGQGYAFQRRPIAGGTSLYTSGGAGAAPGWLRVVRAGPLFTAYRSDDGRNWTVIGSDSIPMADTFYVGIAVTSHSETTATDAVVDGLSVTQTTPVEQPPTVSLTSPADGAIYTAPASIAITANAADPANHLTKVEFYDGATLLGTATAAPYTFTWASVPAGTYSLTAMAYNAAGLQTTSSTVSVTVTAIATPPTDIVTPPTDIVTPPPTGVMFSPSADDATVTSYRVDVFAVGADPNTATPVSSFDAGKPPPDANNDITVSAPSFFSDLSPGTYQLTVSAINATGIGRSSPLSFTR